MKRRDGAKPRGGDGGNRRAADDEASEYRRRRVLLTTRHCPWPHILIPAINHRAVERIARLRPFEIAGDEIACLTHRRIASQPIIACRRIIRALIDDSKRRPKPTSCGGSRWALPRNARSKASFVPRGRPGATSNARLHILSSSDFARDVSPRIGDTLISITLLERATIEVPPFHLPGAWPP